MTGILEPIERASIDGLRALQLERLKWSLAHAYEHVEHYRQSFDAIGAHPADLKQLEDLSRFPGRRAGLHVAFQGGIARHSLSDA
jgi:phenylacetate-CoA ligase